MSKATKSSLFMFSPLPKYAEFYQELLSGTVNYAQLGNRLIQLGERAHLFRQFDKVREVGLVLSNIPVKHYQAVGHYFLAVAANCSGNGDQDEASRLFELAMDAATDSYKVKAMPSLGAIAIRRNDLDSASRYFQEAIRIEKLGPASLPALRGMSILESLEGFHKFAVADLERILPLVRFAPVKDRLDCLNSYAVELSEVGRLQQAERVSSLVIASPLAHYYPEWRETLSDVRSKRKNRSTVTVSRQQIKPECEDETGVVEDRLQTARIQSAIDYITSNLHRKVPVTELAELVNLSPSHLSRLFNLKTGFSPGEYLIKLRMEKARDLLTTSFLSIKQVMAMVGYDVRNRGNFWSQFKKHFELAPSEYRKRFFGRVDK